MFEEIKTAIKMQKFIYQTRNIQNKKMFWKCYRRYITECCIMKKNEFKIRFGSKYYQSFGSRLGDWIEYINDKLYIFFWRIIPIRKIRPKRASILIQHGVSQPVHLKKHVFVNESMLEYFFDQNGFKVVDECLTSLSSTYYIKKNKSETN